MCDLKCHFKAQSAVLSTEAKDAAAEIERRLQLGSKLSEVVSSKEDVLALFDLYRNEAYILTEHKGRFFVSKLLALFLTPCLVDLFVYLCFPPLVGSSERRDGLG